MQKYVEGCDVQDYWAVPIGNLTSKGMGGILANAIMEVIIPSTYLYFTLLILIIIRTRRQIKKNLSDGG